VSDQESADLSWRGFLLKHECQSIGSFITSQTLAGVLATPHFAKVLLEAFATAADSACQGPYHRFRQCSAVGSLSGVAIATDRFTQERKVHENFRAEDGWGCVDHRRSKGVQAPDSYWHWSQDAECSAMR
jgi:hypothetical protein